MLRVDRYLHNCDTCRFRKRRCNDGLRCDKTGYIIEDRYFQGCDEWVGGQRQPLGAMVVACGSDGKREQAPGLSVAPRLFDQEELEANVDGHAV